MSTGGADWRGVVLHWERATINGVVWMLLMEATFNYHWGPVAPATTPDVDEDLVTIGRAGIMSVRAAAPGGQAAFDAAMANTAAASSYTAMCAAADADGITGPEHPANVARRWWLSNGADYPLA